MQILLDQGDGKTNAISFFEKMQKMQKRDCHCYMDTDSHQFLSFLLNSNVGSSELLSKSLNSVVVGIGGISNVGPGQVLQ